MSRSGAAAEQTGPADGWSRVFAGAPDEVARRLLGMVLVRSDGRCLRLVEVEAYGGRDDPASHAYRGRSTRNATMWGPPGRLYVYLCYGLHWCANVTCGTGGEPAAVLLRAGEPVSGIEQMRAARWSGPGGRAPGGGSPDRDLARGPGRLGRAMGIDAAADGADLCSGERGLALAGEPGTCEPDIVAGTRIGVSRGRDLPWRFVDPSSRALSRPVPVGPPPAPADPAGRHAPADPAGRRQPIGT